MKKKDNIVSLVFKGNIFKFIVLGIIIVVTTLLSIKLSTILMEIVDHVVPDNSINKLIGAIVLYFVLCLVSSGLSFVAAYYQMKFGLKVSVEARPTFVDRIFKQSGDYFVENSGGELFQLIVQDIDMTVNFIINNMFGFFAMSLNFVGSLIYLCILNWKLCIVILIFQPLSLLLNKLMTPVLSKYSEKQRNLSADYVLSIQEVVTRPISLILSGAKDKCIDKMNDKMIENYNLTKRMFLINIISSHLASLIQTLITCAIVGYGGYCVISGNLTVGGLVVFMTYSNRLTSSFESLWDIMLEFARLKPIIKRVNRYFNEDVKDREGKIDNHNTPDLVFENVSFSYDDSKSIYDNMSKTFSYGKNYGIVGRTGEGKSTLIKLIYNLWDVQEGMVRIGGSDCYDINPTEVSSVLSYVAADSLILHDTIYNNIVMNNENVSKEEVIEALKKVCLYDEVMEMEQGLDTILGDNGVCISSGQQQRIMLARALVADKKIVILDEPTASLDEGTEKSVMKSIYEAFADKLLIIISHNKSVLYNCDEIVHLKDGKLKVVEA